MLSILNLALAPLLRDRAAKDFSFDKPIANTLRHLFPKRLKACGAFGPIKHVEQLLEPDRAFS